MAISGNAVAYLRRRLLPTTLIHVTALDGIVNVNSLFSLALFLGLTTSGNITFPVSSSAAAGNQHLRRCIAAKGPVLAERLVSSHVYSFSFFLFSSLIAMSLKQAIRTTTNGSIVEEEARVLNAGMGRVNLAALRVGIVASCVGSVLGCGFLTMALVDLVQVKLGPLECTKSFNTLAAIVPLVVLVPSALLIYRDMGNVRRKQRKTWEYGIVTCNKDHYVREYALPPVSSRCVQRVVSTSIIVFSSVGYGPCQSTKAQESTPRSRLGPAKKEKPTHET
ncbi:unnamed protein product [Brassica oleracea var. botrytis]|uniref:Uncharacterized protein n=3 Tax=Brassica TaxID=3705 RepID=A0ABQ8AKQ9_BRANA|nr:hypothetical protein HID58_055487 [Brassica napus]CAF2370935.1 unnamed protein product [Brassica napus]CDY38072.1 BnaC03g75110D [Brassica napus]VDC96377.1 unnamed protein product [Brassica oleracea]